MNENMLIENAEIINVSLGIPDGVGVLSCIVYVKHEGAYSAFGGHRLDSPGRLSKDNVGTEYAAEYIKRILEIAEVSYLNELIGVLIRAKIVGGRFVAIGKVHKDEWFDPEKDLAFLINSKTNIDEKK